MQTLFIGSFVPIADSCAAANSRAYSITSSGRCWRRKGTSRPSVLAVLRYHQLVLGRRLHRQVRRLLALEDAIDIAGRAPKIIEPVKSVGQQAAEFSKLMVRIDGWKAVASSQQCNLCAM